MGGDTNNSVFDSIQENDDLLSTSSYEGFVARKHYAMCLSPRPITSLGPGKNGGRLLWKPCLLAVLASLRVMFKHGHELFTACSRNLRNHSRAYLSIL